MPKQRIVLVGAGHAHLGVLGQAQRLTARGHAVTVIAPGPFWYSGMATGMVGGAYSPADHQVDIAALAASGGAAFVEDEVVGLDREAKQLVLRGGTTIAYDALSLNIGSVVPAIPGAEGAGCYAVKPLAQLAAMRADLEGRFGAGGTVRIVVAGGGATAAELVANVAALALQAGGHADLTIVAGESGFLQHLPPGAAKVAAATLSHTGVAIVPGQVARITNGRAILKGGGALPFDIFLNASGLAPPPLLRGLDLPLDREGAVLVDRHLHSIADPAIHATGDCAAVEGEHLPRIGVYAVRQAPILLHNLLATVEDTAPWAFRPQRRYLWIINLGDGTGLAMRGQLWWRGRSALWLKDRIDRRFIARYRHV